MTFIASLTNVSRAIRFAPVAMRRTDARDLWR